MKLVTSPRVPSESDKLSRVLDQLPAAIASVVPKGSGDEIKEAATLIADAIRKLHFEQQSPEITVNPSLSIERTKWVLKVTSRDSMGRIETMTMTPDR